MDTLRKLATASAIMLTFASVSTAMAQDEPEARYFAVIDTATTYLWPQEFIIKLTDPERIEQAREIVRGGDPTYVHIKGTILPERADYNDLWMFHLDPASIRFFAMDKEECDATPMEVEEHFADIGKGFLKDGLWCPWTSRVIREVKM